MEDSFRVRVDKVFGSLSESPSSLWTLTDEEIQKKQWNRDDPIRQYDDVDDRRRPVINSSNSKKEMESEASFGTELESDLQNLEDDDHADDDDDDDDDDMCSDDSKRKRKSRIHSASATASASSDNNGLDLDDESEIRASIGLDCTLDYEEEEDVYDKVAIGKEKSGERLYMKDINDYGIDVNTFHELPVGFNDVCRDPRANHLAAKLRLKEDSEAAGEVHSLELSGSSQPIASSLSNAESDITSPPDNSGSQDSGSGGLPNLKPILKNKKRDRQCVSKSQKRVRFEHLVDTESEATRYQNQEASNLAKPEDTLVSFTQTSMDRSKYTRYTLESSDDMDGESNRKAYTDFLNLIKKPDTTEMQLDADFSKPTFTPRKSSIVNKESMSRKDASYDTTSPICIAAVDVEENKVSAMEEDESSVANKSGRQYRAKSKIDVDA